MTPKIKRKVAFWLVRKSYVSLNKAIALVNGWHESADDGWVEVLDIIPESEVLSWLEKKRRQKKAVGRVRRVLEKRTAVRQARKRLERVMGWLA